MGAEKINLETKVALLSTEIDNQQNKVKIK